MTEAERKNLHDILAGANATRLAAAQRFVTDRYTMERMVETRRQADLMEALRKAAGTRHMADPMPVMPDPFEGFGPQVLSGAGDGPEPVKTSVAEPLPGNYRAKPMQAGLFVPF